MSSYIGVDWGTSNFRAYLLSKQGEIVDQKNGDKGLKDLKPQEFEQYLLSIIAPWLHDGFKPVILCGMVGSKTGWCEVSYISITDIMDKLPSSAQKITVNHSQLQAYILSGACQDTGDHFDIMRGEETQIFGYLTQYPDFSGYIVLPGTHNKWVKIKDGKPLEFSTFMTGELYQILCQHSILATMVTAGFDQDSFDQGVKQSKQKPLGLTSALFSIRAQKLLKTDSTLHVSSYISGLLIGQEFAAMQNRLQSKPELVFIGSPTLVSNYQHACDLWHLPAQSYDVQTATIAGLFAAIDQIQGDL